MALAPLWHFLAKLPCFALPQPLPPFGTQAAFGLRDGLLSREELRRQFAEDLDRTLPIEMRAARRSHSAVVFHATGPKERHEGTCPFR